eukprot:1159373-Pelagomonas_calceolata.AAC.3
MPLAYAPDSCLITTSSAVYSGQADEVRPIKLTHELTLPISMSLPTTCPAPQKAHGPCDMVQQRPTQHDIAQESTHGATKAHKA